MDVRFKLNLSISVGLLAQSANQYVMGRDTIYLSSDLFHWQSFLFVDRLYGRQCIFVFSLKIPTIHQFNTIQWPK